MKEEELINILKQGVKSPSVDFTVNLMKKIDLQKESVNKQNKRFIYLSVACFLILILSLFIKLPDLTYLNYTIRFSPVIVPIISILFLLYELLHLLELKSKIYPTSTYNNTQQIESEGSAV